MKITTIIAVGEKCIFLLLLVLSTGCSKDVTKQLISYIPNNTQMVLKVQSLEKTKEIVASLNLINNDSSKKLTGFFEELHTIGLRDTIQGLLYVSFSENVAKDFYFIHSKAENYLPNIEKKLMSGSGNIQIGESIYFKKTKQLHILSSDKSLHIKNHQVDQVGQQLLGLVQTLQNDPAFSLIANTSVLPHLLGFSFPEQYTVSPVQDWVYLDTVLDVRSIRISGLAPVQGFLGYDPKIFENTRPEKNTVSKIIPATVDRVITYSFNNYRMLKGNLARKLGKHSSEVSNELDYLLNHTSQISTIVLDNQKAVLLSFKDQYHFQTRLRSNERSVFQKIPIYQFDNPDSFEKILAPLITDFQGNFYCIYDNFAVFANNKNTLKRMINSYHLKELLCHTSWYKDIKKQLSSGSSVTLIDVHKRSSKKTGNNLVKSVSMNSDTDANISVIQLSNDLVIKQHQLKAVCYKKKVDDTHFSTTSKMVELDNEMIATTFTINKQEKNTVNWAAVQDRNNVVYVISKTGKIVWKKHLDKPIMGDFRFIKHPDYEGYQLLCNTATAVYLWGQKGKAVANYPVNFEKPITQPLAVFDYDHNQRYRIMVIQDEIITTLNRNGKKVLGLKFANISNTFITAPEHIKIAAKDYLLLPQEKGKLSITNRIGETLIPIKDTIPFLSNPWYGYLGNFISTTHDNHIIVLSSRGQVMIKKTNLGADHKILVTKDKRLVMYTKGELIIDGEPITRISDSQKSIKMLENDQTFFLTSTDQEYIYLYDELGALCKGFPLQGLQLLDIGYPDDSSSAHFAIQKDKKNIEILKIQLPKI